MKRLAALTIALATIPLAEAGTYSDLKRKDENFTVHWKEQNGEILYDTVCDKYQPGAVIYRNCRREAQINFREKCAQSSNKSGKFCIAKERYAP